MCGGQAGERWNMANEWARNNVVDSITKRCQKNRYTSDGSSTIVAALYCRIRTSNIPDDIGSNADGEERSVILKELSRRLIYELIEKPLA